MASFLSFGNGLMLFLAAAGCTATPAVESKTTATSSAGEVKTSAPLPEVGAKPAEPVRNDFWFSRDPVQGGLVTGRIPTGAEELRLGGSALPVTPDGYFLMGFGRDAPGSVSLTWTNASGQKQRSLSVRPGKWNIQHVNANITGGATSSAEYERRRAPELAQINAARAQNRQSEGWRQKFIWPVKGRISGVFGSQRIYRGTPGSYHSGLDIAGSTGTPYVAPADGVVILTAKSPFTLEGYLLMIDHGMGLNSAFLHSSALLVDVGDVVKQGQIIGRIGTTGRSTGPHLHWGLKWGNERIDPFPLLPPQ